MHYHDALTFLRLLWKFMLWLIFISVNFCFSFVLNCLAYITIPKNNGKIKINWNKKLTTTFMIMNQTFYNLVEINRYERDLASRQCGIRECCFFEQRSSRSRKAKKKNNLNLPSPSLWNGSGIEWERRLVMIYVTIISWTKARLGIDLTRNRKSSSFSWSVESVFPLRVCKCLTVKMSDYYDILEVPRSATDQDIKKA